MHMVTLDATFCSTYYIKILSYIVITLQCIEIIVCLSIHLTEYFYNLTVPFATLILYCSSNK